MISTRIIQPLTAQALPFILCLLSPPVTVRGESRKNQQMPITARHSIILRYSQQKINGERYSGSESSQGSVALSLNPFNVHRPIFERIKRCPLTFNRVHIMKSHDKSTKAPFFQLIINPKPLSRYERFIDVCALSLAHVCRNEAKGGV